MKLSTAKPKIAGIQLGEASLNLIRPDQPPLRAKYALLAEEGDVCGFFEKANGWSEKTLAALQTLAECMEEDALGHIFFIEPGTEQATAEKAEEPPQF